MNTSRAGSRDSMERVLVLGGTGKTGRRVAAGLEAKGIAVRVGSRSGSPPFDWNDESGWDDCLEGVSGAYVSYAAQSFTGLDRMLLAGAGALYLGGVQAPTIAVNIPLDNRVQRLDVGALGSGALREARAEFETRWNRWNVIRTGLATASAVLMLILLTRL